MKKLLIYLTLVLLLIPSIIQAEEFNSKSNLQVIPLEDSHSNLVPENEILEDMELYSSSPILLFDTTHRNVYKIKERKTFSVNENSLGTLNVFVQNIGSKRILFSVNDGGGLGGTNTISSKYVYPGEQHLFQIPGYKLKQYVRYRHVGPSRFQAYLDISLIGTGYENTISGRVRSVYYP